MCRSERKFGRILECLIKDSFRREIQKEFHVTQKRDESRIYPRRAIQINRYYKKGLSERDEVSGKKICHRL